MTAAQLAIDGEIKQRQIAHLSLIWRVIRIAQTCFWRSGRRGPIRSPLFQGTGLGVVVVKFSFSCMVALLVPTEDKHAAANLMSAI